MNADSNTNLLSTLDAAKFAGCTPGYISKLCKSGKLAGVQRDSQWYVDQAVLEQYLAEAQARKEALRAQLSKEREAEYRSRTLLSTQEASALTGYTTGYVAKLRRDGKVEGERIGNEWRVKRASLEAFVRENEAQKEAQRAALAQAREAEYREANLGMQELGVRDQVSGEEREAGIRDQVSGGGAEEQEAGVRDQVSENAEAPAEVLAPAAASAIVAPIAVAETEAAVPVTQISPASAAAPTLQDDADEQREVGAVVPFVLPTIAGASWLSHLRRNAVSVGVALLFILGGSAAVASEPFLHSFVASIQAPAPIPVATSMGIPTYGTVSTSTASSTGNGTSALPPGAHVTLSYPTYHDTYNNSYHNTYQTIVNGVSQDSLNQALTSMRTSLLSQVAGMIQPVSNQVATNVTTIQEVNMIQKLDNLILTNPQISDASITGSSNFSGNSVTATNGTFTNLTAGTTTISGPVAINSSATTTITGRSTSRAATT